MFYFISYTYYDVICCKVIDEHPLKWYNTVDEDKATLINWKQISEEEFEMWGDE